MTTDRPYQKAMSLDEALARIKTFVGTRYDARVVAALVEACEQGQISPGRVKLRSRRVAAPPPANETVPVEQAQLA